jgi:FAD/FMN-containing dehydrogenase
MPDDATVAATAVNDLKATLAGIVGAENVRSDAAGIALNSADIFSAGASPVQLVVSPRSIEEVSRTVAAITGAGFAVSPRGAGMSYTGGYIPMVEHTISLDMSRMDRILAVNPADMTVTVEAGCRWSQLHQTLSPMGLRTPFWGPMSGLVSTIGGGLSQLNAMLGGGHYGTSSESVIALTIVLADGTVLRTGARGADGDSPFYRHYGPDLTGLFCGDSGAFGIKAEITLRLMRLPAHEGYVSLSFKTGRDLVLAMAEIARAGIASETCAFDPGLTRVRLARASLATDVKTLGAVIGQQKSLYKGLIEAGKVALGGRSFVGVDDYSLHVICEGRSAVGVEADLAEARRIAAAGAGTEIENTIAKVIRAVPFPPLNSVLGPAAERWAPVHGLAPLSRAPDVLAAIETLFADMAGTFEREGVTTGYLFTSVSTNALIIEPVFYWPEERFPIHEVAIEPAHLARLPTLPPNPAATAVVVEARHRLIALFQKFGCAHYQIGRTYPYRASRDAATISLLDHLKAHLDPTDRMNPGVLGFPLPGAVPR